MVPILYHDNDFLMSPLIVAAEARRDDNKVAATTDQSDTSNISESAASSDEEELIQHASWKQQHDDSASLCHFLFANAIYPGRKHLITQKKHRKTEHQSRNTTQLGLPQCVYCGSYIRSFLKSDFRLA